MTKLKTNEVNEIVRSAVIGHRYRVGTWPVELVIRRNGAREWLVYQLCDGIAEDKPRVHRSFASALREFNLLSLPDEAATSLRKARQTWPSARLVTARKRHRCDWQTDSGLCCGIIAPGDSYIDPGEANPEKAGGFGGYHYCLTHFDEAAAC